jgi:hypothetical protein
VSPSLEELWQCADLSLQQALADHDSQGIARAVATFEQAADLAGQEGDPNQSAALINLTNALLVQTEESYSDAALGQVTGYAVGLPGHDDGDGEPCWYGGGRLSAALTLPRLRRRWDPARGSTAERSGAFQCTAPERNAIYEHAARLAATAAEHIRRCALGDPARAADAAWAAADALHVAARVLRNPALRRAADSYDRAARARYGRIPQPRARGTSCAPRPGCWH